MHCWRYLPCLIVQCRPEIVCQLINQSTENMLATFLNNQLIFKLVTKLNCQTFAGPSFSLLVNHCQLNILLICAGTETKQIICICHVELLEFLMDIVYHFLTFYKPLITMLWRFWRLVVPWINILMILSLFSLKCELHHMNLCLSDSINMLCCSIDI